MPQQALTANSQNDLARFLPKTDPDLVSGGKDAADKAGLASGKDAARQAPDYDPDLAAVVKCWPGLPDNIRAAIKALVKL